ADVDNHVACKDNYSFGVGFNGMENDPTQGAVNIIHMANGDGESSYSKNSRLQETVIRKALPALKHTISGISKHDDAIFDKCFNIADLGCSSGTNTLLRASNIIDMVHKACKENNRTTPQDGDNSIDMWRLPHIANAYAWCCKSEMHLLPYSQSCTRTVMQSNGRVPTPVQPNGSASSASIPPTSTETPHSYNQTVEDDESGKLSSSS
ncbi:benzoate carboxyl methyltransferase-like protein, partial [Tanacetum coccineum]